MHPEDLDLAHVCFEGKPTVRLRPHAPATPVPGAAAPPSGLPADDFGRWVLARAALDADLYRCQPLQRRTPACLRALKVRSTEAGRALLASRPDLVPVAVSALLIGVTDFFRDPRVFDDLRAKVMPDLASTPGRLRVWSAGCSSGAELYSLAILLAKADLLERSELVGTDCRPDAIAHAAAGVFPPAALHRVPPSMRATWFEPSSVGWRPIERLREHVRWKVADVSEEVEPGPWDLVFFRNTAIYLNARPAARIVRALTGVLRPGGYLVLGNAERPPDRTGVAAVSRCIYRKGANE